LPWIRVHVDTACVSTLSKARNRPGRLLVTGNPRALECFAASMFPFSGTCRTPIRVGVLWGSYSEQPYPCLAHDSKAPLSRQHHDHSVAGLVPTCSFNCTLLLCSGIAAPACSLGAPCKNESACQGQALALLRRRCVLGRAEHLPAEMQAGCCNHGRFACHGRCSQVHVVM
jgi:hypothetical protein